MSVTSLSVLEAAAAHQRARAQAYDQPTGERSAAAVAQAFNAITRRDGDRALSESDAWLFLQILKQVRLYSAPGYHADSAEDNVAYASLLAESKAREAEPHVVGRSRAVASAVAAAARGEGLDVDHVIAGINAEERYGQH